MLYFIHKILYGFSVQRIHTETHMIFGLGNSGKIYEKTRHNAGQLFIKHIAQEFSVKMNDESNGSIGSFQHIILFNHFSFMNSSEHPINKLVDKTNIQTSNIIIVHDDYRWSNVRLNKEKVQKDIMIQNPLSNIWMINSQDQKQELEDQIQKTLQQLVIMR